MGVCTVWFLSKGFICSAYSALNSTLIAVWRVDWQLSAALWPRNKSTGPLQHVHQETTGTLSLCFILDGFSLLSHNCFRCQQPCMVGYIHNHVLVWLQPFLLFHFTQRPDVSYDIELDELTHQKPFKNYSVTPDDYISWQFFFKKKNHRFGG